MPINRSVDVIRAAAAEKRSHADQVISPAKLKTRLTEEAADLERAAARMEEMERSQPELIDLLKKADEALKRHGGMQYTGTWLARDIAAKCSA